MKRINKRLTAAIALALAIPAFSHAPVYADEEEYNLVPIEVNGKTFAEIYTMSTSKNNGSLASTYDLLDSKHASIDYALYAAVGYWSDILAPRAKNTIPWQIMFNSVEIQNAQALTYSLQDGTFLNRLLLADNMQTGSPALVRYAGADQNDTVSFSSVQVGKYMGAGDATNYGWGVDDMTVIPTTEEKADLVGCFRHELVHALGMSFSYDYIDANGTKYNPNDSGSLSAFRQQHPDSMFQDSSRTYQRYMVPEQNNSSAWTYHLVDQYGNAAKEGMQILTPRAFATLKEKDATISQSDYFIVDDLGTMDSGASVSAGYAYFVGDHVSEVLDGATFYGVNGLPVNAWEGSRDTTLNRVIYSFEGSHLQIPGLMSHRPYCNYTTLMEAELAVMQDLGYDFDRKAYYGRSIYNNDSNIINEQGYFARNADGTAYLTDTYSEVPLGIGLHVYGSNNDVTQVGNIMTQGDGAVGIRMDGVNNKLTIAEGTKVNADGYRGIGLLVSYGRNHTVDVNGTVTANGEGGNAVQLDFGSSSNGAVDEYRGSYIRYIRRTQAESEDGNATDPLPGSLLYAYNGDLPMTNKDVYNYEGEELKGALVNDLNVAGTISGSNNAIYISKNAFVKNINIQDGAQLFGDITSDWKHFSGQYYDGDANKPLLQKLQIQYNNTRYDYDTYIPELVTKLNFATTGAMSYDGNITGTDNMKVNVESGTLTYGGTANVVNVKVAPDATLLGGTYTVNDMSSKIASGLTDTETGVFINSGTIGAADDSTNMNINGRLQLNEGATLVGYATGDEDSGIIEVNVPEDSILSSGVFLTDVTVKLNNALPGDEKTVLKTNAWISDKALNYDEASAIEQSALLNVYGYTAGNDQKLIGVAVAADNLGERTDEQQGTLDSVTRMLAKYGGTNEAEVLRPIYNQNQENTKKLLDRIAGNKVIDTNVRLAQQSNLVHDTLAGRMQDYAWKPDELSLGNNLWMKIGKNWGDLRGDGDYRGSNITAGYDWQNGEHSREGVFVAYNKAHLNYDDSSAKLHDTRVGYYTGKQNGAASTLLYGDLGYERTKTKRTLYSGVQAEGKPESYLAEIGAEYKYDLHYGDNRTWHVLPYAGFTASTLHQKDYTESGAGILGQKVDDEWNTYVAVSGGLELARALPDGGIGMRLGLKQSLAGASPDYAVSYVGDGAEHGITNQQDRTHLVMSVQADNEFAKGWHIAAEASAQRGAHDKDFTARLQLKRSW